MIRFVACLLALVPSVAVSQELVPIKWNGNPGEVIVSWKDNPTPATVDQLLANGFKQAKYPDGRPYWFRPASEAG